MTEILTPAGQLTEVFGNHLIVTTLFNVGSLPKCLEPLI